MHGPDGHSGDDAGAVLEGETANMADAQQSEGVYGLSNDPNSVSLIDAAITADQTPPSLVHSVALVMPLCRPHQKRQNSCAYLSERRQQAQRTGSRNQHIHS